MDKTLFIMHLRTTLFILLIIWQFANCNALQNQSSMINEKQDLNILDVTENISTNTATEGKKSFYRYEPEIFLKNQSGRRIPQTVQPRVLTEKVDIEINVNRSVEKLKEQLIKLNYKPVVLLVDETFTAFEDAVFFTEILFKTPNIRSEFWLMVFNASGVSTVIAQSRPNPNEVIQQLIQGVKNLANLKKPEGSAVFFSILKASQILPRESTIILFTERNPIDEDVAQLSVNYIASKFLKLHVIWGATYPSKGHEEKLLEEAVAYTNGLFLFGNTSQMTSENKNFTQSFHQQFKNTKEVIVIKKNLHNAIMIPVPIDRSLQNIEMIIEGKISALVFNSPTGISVDLLDTLSMRRLLASAEFQTSTAHDLNRWTYIRFNTAKVTTTPVIGIWNLRVNGLQNDKNGYNVTIYADTELGVQSQIVNNITRGTSQAGSAKYNEIDLKLKGDISKLENISIIDITGQVIKQLPYNINFKLKESIVNDVKKDVVKHSIKLSENITQDSFYIEVSGTNNNGEKFSRLSYVNQNNIENRRLPMVLVEISHRSELLVYPGSNPKLIFDVTNNYDYPVMVRFSAQDEKRMLRSLYPESIVIGSRQTTEVTIIATVPPNNAVDFTDQVTLTAYTTQKTDKVAVMYVTSTKMRDDYMPRIDYKFASNCMEVPHSSCQNTYWTLELTAQDSQSGLLQVTSIPKGIYSPNGYVSGTKEPVHFYYTATCCQSETEIIAIDLSGNRRSFKVDAYNANLSTAAIAAIVLGGLLLIAILLTIIVVLTRKCKQRDSLDLPRYRGQQTSSTRF